MFAVRKDGTGWRSIGSPAEITEEEVFSTTAPDDDLAFETAVRAKQERNWRDLELKKVLNSMDQISNDQRFGSVTYKGKLTLEQLNKNRVILCSYPDTLGFPWCDRPTLLE